MFPRMSKILLKIYLKIFNNYFFMNKKTPRKRDVFNPQNVYKISYIDTNFDIDWWCIYFDNSSFL